MNTVSVPFKGKCAKQTTIAILNVNGNYYIGTNHCESPQKECPRGDMPSGEGYHFCKQVCNQQGHAEENAIITASEAGEDVDGAILFLIGHYYVCGGCRQLCKDVGIETIIILDDMICTERIKN